MAIKIDKEVDNGSTPRSVPAVNTPPQRNSTKIITAVVLAIVVIGAYMLR